MTGYQEQPEPPAGARGDTLGSLATAAVTSWSRLAEAWFRNVVRLAKVPLELVEDEDPTLGVCRTSVYVTTPKAVPRAAGGAAGGADVACVSIKDATTGAAVASAVTVTPETLTLDGTRQEVVVEVPAGIAPGLYEVTLRLDGTNEPPQSYVVPFGIPL